MTRLCRVGLSLASGDHCPILVPAEVMPKGLAKVKEELQVLKLPVLKFTVQETGDKPSPVLMLGENCHKKPR